MLIWKIAINPDENKLNIQDWCDTVKRFGLNGKHRFRSLFLWLPGSAGDSTAQTETIRKITPSLDMFNFAKMINVIDSIVGAQWFSLPIEHALNTEKWLLCVLPKSTYILREKI